MATEVDSKARSIAREDGKGGGAQWLVPPSRSLLGEKQKSGFNSNSVLHLTMLCLSFSSLVLDF